MAAGGLHAFLIFYRPAKVNLAHCNKQWAQRRETQTNGPRGANSHDAPPRHILRGARL